MPSATMRLSHMGVSKWDQTPAAACVENSPSEFNFPESKHALRQSSGGFSDIKKVKLLLSLSVSSCYLSVQ